MTILTKPRHIATLFALAATAIVTLSCGSGERSDGSDGRWNVLLVTLDTTRADRLGCYGARNAKTPRLDALAERGFVFDRARTHSPLTLPSHASIMTGLLPTEHAVRNNGTYVLEDTHETLAETLTETGYHTAAVVAAYVLDRKFGLDQGFADYDDAIESPAASSFGYAERTADAVTQAALAKADDFPRDQPYFLWAHYFDPHAPYSPPDAFRNAFPSTVVGRYDAEIAWMDHSIGQLLDGLETRGLLDRTLIVVIADHGEGVAGPHEEKSHGIFLYPDTMRIPFIVTTTRGLTADRLGENGGRSDRIVRQIDVMPTLLEWLEQPIPSDVEGRSLAALIRGEETAIEPVLHYSETFFPLDAFGWCPLFAVENEEWKYIEAPRPELYRTADDPLEQNDLSASHGKVLAAMRAALEALRERAGHPLPGADTRALDAADARRLQALGYADGNASARIRDWSDRKDPKDWIALHEDLEAARGDQIEGRFSEALERIESVLAKDPDNFEAIGQKATILLSTGRNEEAIAPLRALTRLLPDAAHHFVRLGGVLQQSAARRAKNGDSEGADRASTEAADAFARAVVLGSPDIAPYVNLGVIKMQRGDLDGAIPLLARAADLDPRSYAAWYNLGHANLLARKLEEAAAALDRARPIAGEDARRRRNVMADRAEVHARLEQFEPALDLYRTLLREYPDDPETTRFETIARELEKALRETDN